MKNVPDWKVGTLWGKPIYENVPENELPPVELMEFYAHRPHKEMREYCRPNNDVGLEDTAH